VRMSLRFTFRPRSTPELPLFPYTTLFRSTFGDLRYRQTPGINCQRRRGKSSIGSSPPSAASIGSPTLGADAVIQTSRVSDNPRRSEEHTSELQSRFDLVCRLLLE